MNDKAGSKQEVSVDQDNYDRGIVPSETAARQDREGSDFKSTSPDNEAQNAEGAKTTEGYTVDKEGLGNNYAIEPEMYVEEPGDMREQQEAEKAERAQELNELKEDEEGNLTEEKDTRHKGQGVI